MTKKMIKLACIVLLLPASLHAAWVRYVYTSSSTFTPTTGVTSVQVECWGGGGAGGSAKRTTTVSAWGSGGGGGAYKKGTVTVTPGTPYSVTIPAVVTAPASGFTHGQVCDSGAAVTFTGDSVSVTANGGTGGKCALDNTAAQTGGAGGAGDKNGGAGGNSVANTSSGGGGGGPSDQNNGSKPVSTDFGYGGASTTGTEWVGGTGPQGRTSNNLGRNGTQPGSGGAAAAATGNNTIYQGGNGGAGQIIISYNTTELAKANNTDNLDQPTSWTGGVVPGTIQSALWSNTVTAANTVSLGADTTWASMIIKDPGGLVTINAGNTLTLGWAAPLDIDMSAATQDLTLNCALALGAANVWDVTTSRTLTVGGAVSGANSLTKQGSGTIVLSVANNYSGGTTVNAGTLQLTHTGALGSSTALTLGNGGTLALRSDTPATFTSPVPGAGVSTIATSATVGLDVNNNGSGSSNTLTLGGGIRLVMPSSTSTINITGGNSYVLNIPTLTIQQTSASPRLTLNPTSASITIGTLAYTFVGAAAFLNLDGTSTGNSISVHTGTWLQIDKANTSTWTVNLTGSQPTRVYLKNGSSGNLIVNGTIKTQSQNTSSGVRVEGGVLHYNNAGAVDTSPGVNAALRLAGGSLDNSSGAAITTSTYNPIMEWNGNWAFVGSNGANSDLNLGTGAVSMGATRQVTIQNAATTLTVGGIISGAGGLTKAGPGTLALAGKNTYTGATTITNGMLIGVTGGSCSNTAVTVTNTTGVTSALGVVVTDTAKPWVCSNLTVRAVSVGDAQIMFTFGVTPSPTQAPLVIRNLLTFSGSPTLVVNPANLQAGRKYPLLTVGGIPPETVPTLSLTGMTGTLGWEESTLYLNIPAAGTLISFM